MSDVKIEEGSFIRVRLDHFDKFRAGKDGLVYKVYENSVGLYFGRDRYNDEQHCICENVELWAFSELDLTTILI